MESAISQLYNLPSDRKEGEVFAEMLKKEIPAERNPLNVLVILKVLEKEGIPVAMNAVNGAIVGAVAKVKG